MLVFGLLRAFSIECRALTKNTHHRFSILLILTIYIYDLRLALIILIVGVGVVLIHFNDTPRFDSLSTIMSLIDPTFEFLDILIYSYYSIYYILRPKALVTRPLTLGYFLML